VAIQGITSLVAKEILREARKRMLINLRKRMLRYILA
jgi:hypothetical protein